MSRFEEGDGENAWMWQGWVARALSSKHALAILEDFVTYLDSLPPEKRRMSSGNFQDVKTGDMCVVAHLCKSRGMSDERIGQVESESYAQRQASYHGTEEDAWRNGATVAAAREVGFSRILAGELAFLNDSYGTWREESTPEKLFEKMYREVVQRRDEARVRIARLEAKQAARR